MLFHKTSPNSNFWANCNTLLLEQSDFPKNVPLKISHNHLSPLSAWICLSHLGWSVRPCQSYCPIVASTRRSGWRQDFLLPGPAEWFHIQLSCRNLLASGPKRRTTAEKYGNSNPGTVQAMKHAQNTCSCIETLKHVCFSVLRCFNSCPLKFSN